MYATLAGKALPVDPDTLDWNFGVKVNVQNTVGGRVVQVFGTTLGTLTVTGSFGKGGWTAQRAFYEHIRDLVDFQSQTRGDQPFRFAYTLKGWDFNVLIQNLGDDTSDNLSVSLDNRIVAPRYNLALFIVQDNTGNIVRGIRDQFISRLMSGVGWKQTDFNGPLDAPANPIGTFITEMETVGAGG